MFVLSFPDDKVRTGDAECFMPSVEIKYITLMIDGQNFFDQPVIK